MPSSSHGFDAINFRHLKESNSLHLQEQFTGVAAAAGIMHPGPGTLGFDDELDLPEGDLFGGFSSVTLHYDGDH